MKFDANRMAILNKFSITKLSKALLWHNIKIWYVLCTMQYIILTLSLVNGYLFIRMLLTGVFFRRFFFLCSVYIKNHLLLNQWWRNFIECMKIPNICCCLFDVLKKSHTWNVRRIIRAITTMYSKRFLLNGRIFVRNTVK